MSELSEQDGIYLMSHLAPQATENETESVLALVQAVGALLLALTLIGRHLHLQERMQQPRRLHTALERLRDVQQGERHLTMRARFGLARVLAARGDGNEARQQAEELLADCDVEDRHFSRKVKRWLRTPVQG